VPRQSTTHVDSQQGVAERLREARSRAGISQAGLAFPGCSPGYISRIEAGERIPSLQVIRELARRLDVEEDWLARGELGAPGAEIDGLLRDADLALRLDDVRTARELFERVAAEAPEPAQRLRAHGGLGQLAFREGRPHDAISHIEEAFADDVDPDDAGLVETLGRAYAAVGENEAAIALLRRALERAERASDPFGVLRFGVLLANVYIDEARFGEATELLARLLADAREGHPLTLARVYWSQSRLHSLRGEPATAARLARRALELLEATEHTYHLAKAHHMSAFAELDAGRPTEALELLRRGRTLLGPDPTVLDLAEFDIEEARALAQLGQLEDAASLAMATAARFRDGHPLDVGRSFGELAAIFDEIGDRERARELYELAVEMLERQPNRYLAEVYSRYGDLLESAGQQHEALDIFRRGTRLQAELRGRVLR
jgi:tetratricopeptide (TPR) repeat protein